MNQQDAMAIMAALEDGHTFEFANYYDGVREVLEFDPSADQFTLTAHHAYSGDQEQETFNSGDLRRVATENISIPP